MQKSDWIICGMLLLNIAVVMIAFHVIHEEITEKAQQARDDLQRHQEWLFNQLYSLGPGKVLRPDELEEKVVNLPGKVINPNKDPYAEFKGKKDDWA